MPGLDDSSYLQPDETPILQARRVPLSALPPLLGALLGASLGCTAAVLIIRALPSPSPARAWLPYILAGVVALALLDMAFTVLRTLTTRYTVTDTRIYVRHGRLRFHLVQTTYDKLTDLHVRQGPLGRLSGYGTVRLVTAGTSLAFAGIHDPLAFKRDVEAARTAFLQKLVRSHRARAARAAASDKVASATHLVAGQPKTAEGAAEPVVAWRGGPAPASLVERLTGSAFLLVAGIVLLVMGTAFGTGPGALTGGAMLAVALLAGTAAILQFRASRFEVTSSGVVATGGTIGRHRSETTYGKVTDVTTTQGLLGRIFGYGTIKVNTAGSASAAVTFQNVPEPERIKALIDAARGAR